MVSTIYLDAASATPLLPEAREAFIAAADTFGDPLMIHGPGRLARSMLDEGREAVAAAIGAQADEIVFTSGGTESVALAIWGGVRAMRELGSRVVVSAVEHPSVGGVGNVLASDGFELVEIPADDVRRMDMDRFAAEIRVPGTLLASVQHANHELGTMQQVGEAARLAREAKRSVPHRRVPDGRAPAGRRRRARAWICCRCRRTSSADRRASGPSTCGVASGSPRIRAVTTGSANGAPAWRTHRASPPWRPPCRCPWPPWAMPPPRSGRSPRPFGKASRHRCPVPMSMGTRPTARPIWSASAWTGSTLRPS